MSLRGRVSVPLLVAMAVVAATLGGLLVGFEPVGGDPDLLYRPIKGELARALREGTLPFWSDRFGLGVPLAAESHAAAFYPPNWLLFRALGVSAAYRLSMWLHHLAAIAAAYAYARTLGISPWGGALAGVTLALCGFQASHACHEPFYHALPFLPLSLALAERYLADGRQSRLAFLAMALGAQATLGHFQIPFWTSGLVALTGVWRAARGERRWSRAAGLVAGVAWGAAIASAQLLLTWDLARAAQFNRAAKSLAIFAFPPHHWAQLVLPRLFLDLRGRAGADYWGTQLTTTDEACLYVGAVPLVLALVGFLARGDRALTPWRWAAPAALALATMPRWWPDGYWLILQLPGLGTFRAPGRYTLLTSLGLSLLAGRGLDRSIQAARFWSGIGLASVVGTAAIAWGLAWSRRPEVSPALAGPGWPDPIALGAVAWLIALAAVGLWRGRRWPDWLPLILASIELAYLYQHGPTPWGRPVPFPGGSPVFRALAGEARVGLVAGDLQDLPPRAGLTTAYPNLGIVAPPPNYLLEESKRPTTDPRSVRRRGRFGVTHAVYGDTDGPATGEVVYRGPDPTLDALLPAKAGDPSPRTWRLERFEGASPEVHCARSARVVDGWPGMFDAISRPADPDVVTYQRRDRPADPDGPRAKAARVARWDGRSGEVEHDGTCDLVLRRTAVPGWWARVDGGPERPILPADGGLQAIRLEGSGVSRVTVRYRPPPLTLGLTASLAALTLALAVVALGTGLAPPGVIRGADGEGPSGRAPPPRPDPAGTPSPSSSGG